MSTFEGNAFNYNLEPSSPKGLHRYLDFISMLPEHVQNRDELVNFVYMFQDYLNDGYRKIPDPVTTYQFVNKNANKCGITPEKVTLTERKRPYNHTPSMYRERMGTPITPSGYSVTNGVGSWAVPAQDVSYVEEYDKERDLDTWAIPEDVMSVYKTTNDTILLGNNSGGLYSYFKENRQWRSVLEYYTAFSAIVDQYGTTNTFPVNLFLSTNEASITSSLAESTLTLDQTKEFFDVEGDYSNIEFYYYACSMTDFLSDFFSFAGDASVLFTLADTKYQQFNGITDTTNYATTPYFSFENLTYDEIVADNNIPSEYNSNFRVIFKIDPSVNPTVNKTDILTMLNGIGDRGYYAISANITSLAQFTPFVTGAAYPNVPCIGYALTVIPAYQHPDVFFNYFSDQNEYRHDPKKASIVEKIYRLAYMKDPSVVDYEYIGLVSRHFGYSIETDEDQINQNTYYITKEEKEEVVRRIISNMPEYYKMKGTDNGIEMVLLSFGLVAKVIHLFTRGDNKTDGYVEFVDERYVDSDIVNYNSISPITPTQPATIAEEQLSRSLAQQLHGNARVSGTAFDDWYPSPHFRIELNILEDNLSILRSSVQFNTIAKTIRKIKPINTVFQGFYGVMMAAYEKIFLNPPSTLSRAYMNHTMTSVSDPRVIDDRWVTFCGIEVEV